MDPAANLGIQSQRKEDVGDFFLSVHNENPSLFLFFSVVYKWNGRSISTIDLRMMAQHVLVSFLSSLFSSSKWDFAAEKPEAGKQNMLFIVHGEISCHVKNLSWYLALLASNRSDESEEYGESLLRIC
jgi:hypothetical protein